MTLNFNTYFDEKYDEGGLTPTEGKKSSVSHVPDTRNGIPRRELKGDRNQCAACDEYFNSTHAFTKHRVGSFEPDTRRCLTVAEMEAMKFGKTKDDFWLSPIALKDRERLNQIRNRSRHLTKKP